MKHAAIAAILFCLAAPLGAQEPGSSPWNGERLILPDMSGYELVHEHHDILSERRYVPIGESEDTFTRIITVETATPRVHQGRLAAETLSFLQASLTEECAGEIPGDIHIFEIDGHPAARMRFDCPRTKDNPQYQAAFFLALDGTPDLYMITVGIPHEPNDTEERWADAFLASIRLCPADSIEDCP